jgi:hypothetical protein
MTEGRRPLYIGVRHPSGTPDQSSYFFLLFLDLNKFGYEFHISKREKKMFASTRVWNHLICDMQLKYYCVDTSSINMWADIVGV